MSDKTVDASRRGDDTAPVDDSVLDHGDDGTTSLGDTGHVDPDREVQAPGSPGGRATAQPPERGSLLPVLVNGEVVGTFPRLVDLEFELNRARSREAPDPKLIEQLDLQRDQTLTAFERHAGPIIYSFYGFWADVACVLTGTPKDKERSSKTDLRILRRLPAVSDENSEATDLVLRALVLAQQSETYLDREEGDRCISIAYGVIEACMSLIDEISRRRYSDQPVSDSQKTIDILRKQLAQAQLHYDASLVLMRAQEDAIRDDGVRTYQRWARTRYIVAMLFTVVALGLLGWLAFHVLRDNLSVGSGEVAIACSTFVAGAAGAAVSVMSRMTKAQLTIQPDLDNFQVTVLGSFRAVLGAIFGLVFFFLVRSELLPLVVPGGNAELYFFPALGFIAGFSERLAQDTLTKAAAVIPAVVVPTDTGSTKAAGESHTAP